MRYTYERLPSRPAFWSYRLAVFLVPFFIVTIVGHRTDFIPTPALIWLLAIGFGLALIGFVCGVAGFRDLWLKGYDGGLKTTWGTAITMFLLLPAAYMGWQAYNSPPIYDITTDLEDAPEYEVLSEDKSRTVQPLAQFDPATVALAQASYPQLVSRRYRASADRVFIEALAIAEYNGWQVVEESPPDIVDIVDSDLRIIEAPKSPLEVKPEDFEPAAVVPKDKPVRPAEDIDGLLEKAAAAADSADDESGSEGQESQAELESEGYIEAIAYSTVLRVKSDVIIRVVQEEETTLVDMRSTSRFQSRDLGANAKQITDFLEALDGALVGVAGKDAPTN